MNKNYENLYKDILPSEELKSRVINAAKENIANGKTSKRKLLPRLVWSAAAFAAAIVFSLTMFFNVPRTVNSVIAAINDFYIFTPSEQGNVSPFSTSEIINNEIDEEFLNAAALAMDGDCVLISLRGKVIESSVYLTGSEQYGIFGFIQYKICVLEIFDSYNLKMVLPENSTITLIYYLHSPSDLAKYIPNDSFVRIKAYTASDFNPKDSSSIAIGFTNGFVCYTIGQNIDSIMPDGK